MDAALEAQVRRRAHGRCEYCCLPQPASGIAFQIDHIIARHHKGRTAATNLALACVYCNGYKGPNISGLDPLTGKLTPLFNPRRHKWTHHFRYDGGELIGRTAIGRTTVEVLRINQPNLIALRELLMEDGLFS
jgi:HNH endonuclease